MVSVVSERFLMDDGSSDSEAEINSTLNDRSCTYEGYGTSTAAAVSETETEGFQLMVW